jgi:hypothetical protein
MVQLRRFSIFLLLSACATASWGQTSSGTITGRVIDPSGAAVSAAEARLINQATKDARTLMTSANGDFSFTDVQPGVYTIVVKFRGFKQFEKSNLNLTASERLATGDLRLEVGNVSETVEVRAAGAPIQTESSERSALIDSRQITELMARGRDVMALLQTLPGAVNDSTGGDTLGQFTTPTMDGTRREYNALNIDGISGNTARGRTAESPINMDAIAEVKVLKSSYPAEYGTASGAVINIVTKGGTQRFHGLGYYYNRNEALNANTFFNNRQGIARQRYRYNTTGYNIGGPIYWPNHFNANKQKLFFFFSQEILPNQSPNSIRNFTVPTALERQGDFSQSFKAAGQLYIVKDPQNGQPFGNNMIPASRMDPISAKLLTIFPLPNATNTAVTRYQYNFQIAGTEDIPVKQELLKVDYNISEKARMWARGSGYSSHNTGLTSPAISNQWGPTPVDYAQTMPNLGGSFTYIFSPSLVNEATFGLNLWTEQQLVSQDGIKLLQRANYGINIPQSYPKDNPLGLLPSMSFGGIPSAASISYDGRFPMVDDATALSFSDGLSKVWKTHQFKAGILIQHVLYNQYHQAGSNNFPGNFAFAADANNPNDSGYAYANAFLGNYDTYTEGTGRVNYAPVTRIFEWYVQDSWKVTHRLTMDIGLRFTWALPQIPNNNQAANFIPSLFNPANAPKLYTPAVVGGKKVVIDPTTGAVVPNVYQGLIVPGSGNPVNGVVVSGTKGYPDALVYSNGILTGPRFGLAWDPFGDGKMAVRLGGGFFYNPRADAGALGNLSFNPPLIFNPTNYYGNVVTAANTTGLISPSSFSRNLDLHSKTVTSYQATLGIQRQLGWGTVLDVAYVGSFGRHLGENVALNTVPYGSQFLPQNQNPQTGTPLNDNYFRPYPGYNGVPMQIFEGNSSYHSLQVQANRRFATGVQFGVAYTFSKAMNYGESDSTGGGLSTPTGAGAYSPDVATYQNRKIWNYSVASYDRPHILTFYFLYNLPRLSRVLPNPVVKAVFDGWQVSDISSFISGQPLAVTMGTNPTVNFTGGGDGARPIVAANPNLPRDQRTFDQYFNTAAFFEPIPALPGQVQTVQNFGDMPRLAVRGPGVGNWNTSLRKILTVKERLMFELRAEAYNTFNHTQYSSVTTGYTFNAARVNTNAATGQVSAARDPRIMQLALRITF